MLGGPRSALEFYRNRGRGAVIICVGLVTIVRSVAEEWLRLNRLSARRASPAGPECDYGRA